MSSEAAYFPDALASKPEALGLGLSASEIPSEPLDEAQVQIDVPARPAAPVIEISEISDELLLEQVQEGAKEALGVLFRRHARSVRNVAYRVLRNEAEADDLVQEVFLFIFRKAALFDVAVPGSSKLLTTVPSTGAGTLPRAISIRPRNWMTRLSVWPTTGESLSFTSCPSKAFLARS